MESGGHSTVDAEGGFALRGLVDDRGVIDLRDVLSELEAKGRAKREAVRASRKTPEVKLSKRRGANIRNRGYRSEKRAEKVLSRFGFVRVPMSGVLDGWPGDLVRKVSDGKVLSRMENKRRSSGWKTLRGWLEQEGADFLRLDEPGREALYVIPEGKMLLLLEEAGYDADRCKNS